MMSSSPQYPESQQPSATGIPRLASFSSHPSAAGQQPVLHSTQPAAIPRAPARSEDEVNLNLLLVAPDPPAGAVAQALRRELDAHVHVAANGRSALAALRREEFGLIVLEENLAAAEPDAATALFAGAGTAPVLEINFGLCGIDRILRQVRSALRRSAENEAKARLAVAHTLQNQLNASLAGLLLESQLALRGAGPEMVPTLQILIELASELREQLRQ